MAIGGVPAISQRTTSRSNRNSTARCQASSRERMFPLTTSAYWSRVAGVIEPRSTSTESAGSPYENSGAFRRDFFAMGLDGSVLAVRKPTRPREQGRGERVLPGVWRLRLPLDLPGVPHVNAWALQSGDGIVLVDTGMHDRGTMGHLEQALERTGHRVERHPADRHHPRPHRPLRPGAAAGRARGL